MEEDIADSSDKYFLGFPQVWICACEIKTQLYADWKPLRHM